MSETEVYLKRQIDELKRELDRLKTNVPEVGGVWQDWTPTVTSQFGSGGTATSVCKYAVVGGILFCNMQVNITAVGTSSGYVGVSFPPGFKSKNFIVGIAREGFAVGKSGICLAGANGSIFEFTALDNSTFWILNYGFWATLAFEFYVA
jgi:hypothetical protein